MFLRLLNKEQVSFKSLVSKIEDPRNANKIYRDLSIAEYVSGKIHVPHVSSYKSLEVIKNFKDKGVNISSEVTPHHLFFTDDLLKNYDTNMKVAPPIRSLNDKKALIQAVKSGLIEFLQ